MFLFKCISNNSKHEKLEVGKTYELFWHNNPKIVWVKVPDGNSVGYITIQCYKEDFQSIDSWRNNQINNIIGN